MVVDLDNSYRRRMTNMMIMKVMIIILMMVIMIMMNRPGERVQKRGGND